MHAEGVPWAGWTNSCVAVLSTNHRENHQSCEFFHMETQLLIQSTFVPSVPSEYPRVQSESRLQAFTFTQNGNFGVLGGSLINLPVGQLCLHKMLSVLCRENRGRTSPPKKAATSFSQPKSAISIQISLFTRACRRTWDCGSIWTLCL